MYKIIYIIDYKNFKRGDCNYVSNNIAHGLIDKGIATIYSEQKEKLLKNEIRTEIIEKRRKDKMMRAQKKEEQSENKYQIK